MEAADTLSTNAMVLAAANGHLEAVEWFHFNRLEGCHVDRAMDLAALGGHLTVIEWLHANRQEGCTLCAMDFAVERGHLSIMDWLHRHKHLGYSRFALDNAASSGYLSVLEWLATNDCQRFRATLVDSPPCEPNLEVNTRDPSSVFQGVRSLAKSNIHFNEGFAVLKWFFAYTLSDVSTWWEREEK